MFLWKRVHLLWHLHLWKSSRVVPPQELEVLCLGIHSSPLGELLVPLGPSWSPSGILHSVHRNWQDHIYFLEFCICHSVIILCSGLTQGVCEDLLIARNVAYLDSGCWGSSFEGAVVLVIRVWYWCLGEAYDLFPPQHFRHSCNDETCDTWTLLQAYLFQLVNILFEMSVSAWEA